MTFNFAAVGQEMQLYLVDEASGAATLISPFAAPRAIGSTLNAATRFGFDINAVSDVADFPHGLFDFSTTGCTPGSTISMTITYPAALPAGTQYWKYGPTPTNAVPHWYMLPATIAGSTASFPRYRRLASGCSRCSRR